MIADFTELLTLFPNALISGLVMAVVCALVGVFVLLKRVVFIGITLSETAACGIAAAMLLGLPPLAGAVTLTAAVVALLSLPWERGPLPRDALLGIVFLAASALSILLVAHSGFGLHEIKVMLYGDLILAGPADRNMLLLTALPALIFFVLFIRPTLYTFLDPEAARTMGLACRFWELAFFFLLGLVVSAASKSGGVLLVFCYLVAPPATALLLGRSIGAVLLIAPLAGILATLGGLTLAYGRDWPANQTIILLACALPAAAWIIQAARRGSRTRHPTQRRKIMKKGTIRIITALAFLTASMAAGLPARAETAGRTVLATTFPMYQLTRNVTQGREGLRVELMLPAQQGCPHDYALTPQDMQKLARAQILVVNGLGMEEFLGAPVQKANPTLRVIDSSAGIEETLAYAEDHPHHHEPGHDHDTEHADHGPEADHHEHGEDHDAAHHDHGHGHHHAHAGKNPHLFASPRMSARLALNIAAELSKADPDGAALYFKNAQVYAETMNRLADEMAALGKRLKNNRIVEPHGVFDYLARDMGLEIVAVMLAHGQEPSASEMMRIVKSIKEKRAGAIFTEPQYPEKIGKTLSKETGIPVAMIDPVATGPENAPLTYYETVMRQNMGTFASTMGVK